MAREYIAASYGPRYSDPSGIFVALRPMGDDGDVWNKVRDAASRAADFEREDLPGYCDYEHEDEQDRLSCSLCNPDIVESGAFAYSACELFTARELAEHRRELAQGKVIALSL